MATHVTYCTVSSAKLSADHVTN